MLKIYNSTNSHLFMCSLPGVGYFVFSIYDRVKPMHMVFTVFPLAHIIKKHHE